MAKNTIIADSFSNVYKSVCFYSIYGILANESEKKKTVKIKSCKMYTEKRKKKTTIKPEAALLYFLDGRGV